MYKTLIVGDLHLRKEQPFLSAAQTILEKILSITSTDDHVIFLGDFFHGSRPYPEELKVANNFFSDFKGHITILAGNHEYLQIRDSFAEDAFRDNPITFIDTPREVHSTEGDYLFLPHVPYSRFNKLGFNDLRSYYEYWLGEWEPKYPDSNKPLFVLYHFEDETVFAGVDELGVDLSVIESKVPNRKVVRIGGHVHNPSGGYLGTPYMTRKDDGDPNRKFYILEIDRDRETEFTQVEIPSLIKYIDVDYDYLDSLDLEEGISYILSVLGVPSVESLFEWKERHPNVWIEDYTLKFGDERVLLEEAEGKTENIRELLRLFIEQNKVDPDTANYLLSVF